MSTDNHCWDWYFLRITFSVKLSSPLIEILVEPEFPIVNFYSGGGDNSLDWVEFGIHATAENAASIAINNTVLDSHIKVVILSPTERFEFSGLETLLETKMSIDAQGIQVSDVVSSSCGSQPGNLGDWIPVPCLGNTKVAFEALDFETDPSGYKAPTALFVTLTP